MAFYVYKKQKPKLIKKKIKKAKVDKPFFIPMLFFVTGISIIAYLAFPYLSYYLSQTFKIDTLSKELLSPQDTFVAYAKEDESANSDYTKNVEDNISSVNKEIAATTIDMSDIANEKGKMYISIPKIGLKKISVNINTPSDSEAQYDGVLSSNVAHFKGTALPGHPGKTFLYGHSSRNLFSGGARTFASGIFTDIDQLNLGDEFTIDYKGKTYTYSVFKVKLVEKDDYSVVYGDSRKTVSLMTCKPDGIGSSRLIVEAVQEND